ncbi:MAG: histidine kinase [Chitinophagaceae bacterium]|nr:histidine kinase [Chitinophagaceae bacterium]
MTRTQRYLSYAVVIFMMVWGLDLINAVKFNQPITPGNSFSPLHFSQIIYSLGTFLLCRELFRRIIPQRKYIWILPAVIILILFFTITRYILEEVLSPLFFDYRNYREGTSILYYILDNAYYALVYIMLGTLLYLLDAQIQQQKDQAALMQKNREAELQFLRTQINPHFLFNTLNNIYSLVYDKSPEAPGAVLQLSALMRYLLYEKNERVPLKKEWDYIQHFIALQQLRFEQQVEVRQRLNGNWEDWPIAPYLFIPFF